MSKRAKRVVVVLTITLIIVFLIIRWGYKHTCYSAIDDLDLVNLPDEAEVVYVSKAHVADVYWPHVRAEKVIYCENGSEYVEELINQNNSSLAIQNIKVWDMSGPVEKDGNAMWFFGKKENKTSEEVNTAEIYNELADLLRLPEENQGMIDDPEQYYADKTDRFEDRGIEKEDADIDIIRWIGIVDELLELNKAYEFDWNCELEDFTYGLGQIMPEELSLDEISFNEEDGISVWAKDINESWKYNGYVLMGLDIDSDSYVTLICKKEDFEKISELAKTIGHKAALIQDM